MRAKVDPKFVACPKCNVPSGEYCEANLFRAGVFIARVFVTPHRQRIKLARERSQQKDRA